MIIIIITIAIHNTNGQKGKDCHIWFTCLRSLRNHVLECTTAITEVTVAEISTVLKFAEDNPHGAAVVTIGYKICAWINTVH